MNGQSGVDERFTAQLLDEAEATIAQLQCMLLEVLTPRQFELVQKLSEATRVLTLVRHADGHSLPPRPAPALASPATSVTAL